MNGRNLLLASGLLWSITAAANPLCPQPLRAGWDPWEPYHFQDAGGRMAGSAAEVLQEAAWRVGCELQFQRRAWARTVADIEAGALDVAMEVQYLPSRARYALFSAPYRRVDVRLWVWGGRVPAPEARGLASLLAEGVRIGAVTGYAYGEAADRQLAEGVKRGLVQYVRADEQNVRKLQSGRLDGFLTDRASAAMAAREAGLAGQLVAHPGLTLPQDVSLMFSVASVPRELVVQFDQALAAMARDGTLAHTIHRYHPEGGQQLAQGRR